MSAHDITKAETSRRQPAHPLVESQDSPLNDGSAREWRIAPWGFLETLELRPTVECENMDARRPYTLRVELLRAADEPGGSWERVPLDVTVIVRDVGSGIPAPTQRG